MNRNTNLIFTLFATIKKSFCFLLTWRSLPLYELISYVFMFSGISMLAHGSGSYTTGELRVVVLTLLSLYSGFFAALIWNDITDAEIDAVVHPDRPIPSLKISSKIFFSVGLFFSFLTFLFSFFVNIYFFGIVLLLAVFVAVHNKYLKTTISLPAFSEIFTPFQWSMVPVLGYLSFQRFDFFSIMILTLFTYFAVSSHDIIDGIHDQKGDKRKGVQTYVISFGVNTAVSIAFIWFVISGIFGFLIYVFTPVRLFFLLIFSFLYFYTLFHYYKLIHIDRKHIEKESLRYGRIGYNYFIFTFVIIFFDLIIQMLFLN